MRLSDNQAHLLFQIAIDSLSLVDGASSPFRITADQRRVLVNAILTQQDTLIKDLSEDTHVHSHEHEHADDPGPGPGE